MQVQFLFTIKRKLAINIVVIIKILVLILGCSLFFSCNKTNADVASKDTGNFVATCPTNTPVIIEVGYLQTEEIFLCAGQELTVTFTNLAEESRCPLGVDCPWMGRAVVGFTFSYTTSEIPIELGQSIQFAWNGYTILAKFIELNPYPIYGIPLNINDYVAKIAFSSL